MMLSELNIDALVGPTHHFGGLGVGNIASQGHKSQPSSPRRAALEGLRKAELVAGLGVPQFVWLPPIRPRLDLLTQLGFSGSISQQIEQAYHTAPHALSAAFSSAFMWAANAATITPAVDAVDRRYHFTPANLISSWHRATEASERHEDLQLLFGQSATCTIHAPLPSIVPLRDEGAANHMRLCSDDGMIGFNVFVHGEEDGSRIQPGFLPRHTRAASEALARLHGLHPDRTFFLHQHPRAISAGVFHNDVIATSHESLLLHHEFAFLDAEKELARLEKSSVEHLGRPLQRIEVSDQTLPLSDAVSSYFFNSQIVSPEKQPGRDHPRMVMFCPKQCEEIETARKLVDSIVADPDLPIDEVIFVPLGESMANGGGPACLRLRVSVNQELLKSMPTALQLDSEAVDLLTSLIESHYPESLCLENFLQEELVDDLLHASKEIRRRVQTRTV